MKKARDSSASDIRRRVRLDDLVVVHGVTGVWQVVRTYSIGPRGSQEASYVLRSHGRVMHALRWDFTRVYWADDDSGALVSVEPARADAGSHAAKA